LFKQAASGSDVIVRATSAFQPSQAGPGGGGGEQRDPIPQDLVATVAGVPGGRSAAGGVTGYAQMVDPKTGDAIGGVGPPTFGANWNQTANAALELRSGDPPTGPDQVVVDAATAKKYRLSEGQTNRVLIKGTTRELGI